MAMEEKVIFRQEEDFEGEGDEDDI
jgi:hypothetical protein